MKELTHEEKRLGLAFLEVWAELRTGIQTAYGFPWLLDMFACMLMYVT